jgi:2-oxoglutarate ferredoxin oxidoreductase subunit alpha
MVVYAPSSVQEAADCVIDAFDVADIYRIPVMVLGDGMIAQMMEPVEFRPHKQSQLPEKPWAATGHKASEKKALINSLYIEAEEMQEVMGRLAKVYEQITDNEVRYEEYMMDDADMCIVAYGTTARIVKNAVTKARKEHGIKAGLIRPITVWPFPSKPISDAAEKCKAFLAVEMSTGQMLEDVKLSVNGKRPVSFLGTVGGTSPTPQMIVDKLKAIKEGL